MTRRSLLAGTGRSLLVGAVLSAVAACGSTDPEPLNLSGRWSGATEDGTAVTLNLTHDLSTNRLSGTWTLAFGGVSVGTGTTDGHLSSGSVTLGMHFEDRGSWGFYSYTGAVVDDETIRGTIRDDAGWTPPVELKKG